MRITGIVSLVAVVCIGSASIVGQQPTNGLPPKENRFGEPVRVADQDALAATLPVSDPGAQSASGATPRSKTDSRLRLTLTPADPNVDPAIRHDVPEDGPRF